LQSPLLHGEIRPTNDAVAPKQRHCIIAELALWRRRISLETVRPAPQEFEAVAVPHNWIERSQQSHRARRLKTRHILLGWPIPINATDPGMREPLFDPLQCTL